ncbi:hypothetical protein CP533_0309 [Ophiocordyceps camponoti-saundersi (nom. inval.)]|nr:hypothetical protein CP533_0309 [Ophiocordyceps camponoti-saundersi (nom. inval.)]
MDDDLIDYDSDDLMMNDPQPTHTSKLDEVEVLLDLTEDVIDTNSATPTEPQQTKESVVAASPPFTVDLENQQHLDQDIDVPDADGVSDNGVTTVTENRRESVHEIDYEDENFSFEAIHESNNQLSAAENPADATMSEPKEPGTFDDKESHEPYEIDWRDYKSQDASLASNQILEGSPADGGNSAEPTQATSTIDDRFAHLPTIWVKYKGQDYPFFSLSTDGFFMDENILTQPMRDVLQGFRTELSTEVGADDDLVFQVDKLGLEFSEAGKPIRSSPDDALTDICMQELLTILEMLVHNQDPDSDANDRAMYTFLFTRPNTMKRFLTLREISAEGTTLLDAMYSFQPPVDERVAEVVEEANVSNDGHGTADDPEITGGDEATYGEEEQGDELGDDADYAQEPSDDDEAIRDEGAIDYDDEFDANAADDGQQPEPEVAGAESASASGDPDEPGGEDVVEAGQEDDHDANLVDAADNEDLIEFTVDDLDTESANTGAAQHADGDHDTTLAVGVDAIGEATLVDEDAGDVIADVEAENGGNRADVVEEASGDVKEIDAENAASAHRAQYDEDLIDYSDDKLAVAHSIGQGKKVDEDLIDYSDDKIAVVHNTGQDKKGDGLVNYNTADKLASVCSTGQDKKGDDDLIDYSDDKLAVACTTAQYKKGSEDLIDYSDDKIAVVHSTVQYKNGDEDLIDYSDDKIADLYITGKSEKGNDTTTNRTISCDVDSDEAGDRHAVVEETLVGTGDKFDVGEGSSSIQGSRGGLAGVKADEEVAGTRRTGPHGLSTPDVSLGSTAAGNGLVASQVETILEAALDVDLGGTCEVGDAQASATHQSAEGRPENGGTTDSSTTATLRDNGEAPLATDDAVTTTLHGSGSAQLFEIDWGFGAADDGKDDAGEPLKALKREHPTESDGEDGNGMVKRFEAATGSAKVKQTSSVVDPEAAPSFTLTRVAL